MQNAMLLLQVAIAGVIKSFQPSAFFVKNSNVCISKLVSAKIFSYIWIKEKGILTISKVQIREN